MTEMLKSTVPWTWGDRELAAFNGLKQAMRDKVTMHFPDPALPYHLYIDASDHALGATLNQRDEQGRDKLICCLSKKLNSAEHNYPVHEHEFLALLTALKKWKHYLGGGARVIAHTCNIAIRHWTTAPNLSPRVIRLIDDVESFNVDFEHIPVTSNTAPMPFRASVH